MSEESPSRARRQRGARGKLRKAQEIDHVLVEEPFQLLLPERNDGTNNDGDRVGEGCYVSTTLHNRRYYGVFIDQASLKTASMLYFEDEASGLELNRRMEFLLQQKRRKETNAGTTSNQDDEDDNNEKKRPANDDIESQEDTKRQKLDTIPDKMEEETNELKPEANKLDQPLSTDVITKKVTEQVATAATTPTLLQQVQKFRYVESTKNKDNNQTVPGYRLLLATYADVNAAAEDDVNKAKLIEAACQAGGDFVGNYFYQFEQKLSTLCAPLSQKSVDEAALRMSMGFQTFLHNTILPDWFPLSNLHGSQQKVLSMLSMKRDKHGNVIWDENAKPSAASFITTRTKLIPMEPRSRYRVCVVGGGIAGLSCCLELFRICDQEQIDVEVVLVEGRARLGGRLFTDRETFTTSDGIQFPVDLGASWIHGIDLNPMATVAKEANATFVTTSEDVKMFQAGHVEVDSKKDERAGQIFDDLLDHAANDCWSLSNSSCLPRSNQTAVRWYASALHEDRIKSDEPASATAPPAHRRSNDMSVDDAVARAILKHNLPDFALLSVEERRMLMWNLKNVEYALGANVGDLSMKFWDIDERHAFEGDHVILKEGYSFVVDHLVNNLKQYGDRFKHHTSFSVGKIEYNRKTTTSSYLPGGRTLKTVDLSDTCCVTSQDKSHEIKCDFVVSAVPLGVLKASMKQEHTSATISFDPPLPNMKQDAIEAVGFGLLNKVYIQFPTAFWRSDDIIGDKCQFGNASGKNPHHYMFLDIGKALNQGDDKGPAILMSLVSGSEAVKCERMSGSDVVGEILDTLRFLFSKVTVPDPIAFKVTKWGSDVFSRGSYTFLPPGTTDQDFETLQSPVNGNGDSLLLEGSETMRLFFAGEHTTALHPSMSHGALLSGVRAAKEIVDSISLNFASDKRIDHVIPIAMFRYMNPKRSLKCAMCHKEGASPREGNLLAFKKGARQILCHSNCAENSPEVEVFEGKWKDVFTAVNRSRSLVCVLCKQIGATIVCSHVDCGRRYHFSCGEDTGWKFDLDGKEFFCDKHRTIDREVISRLSMDYFRSLNPLPERFACAFCSSNEESDDLGEKLVFRRFAGASSTLDSIIVVHEKCIRFTNIVDVKEDSMNRIEKEFQNVFTALQLARECSTCKKPGATITCNVDSCSHCYHFSCAKSIFGNIETRSHAFACLDHGVDSKPSQIGETSLENKSLGKPQSDGKELSEKGDTESLKTHNQADAPEVVEISDDDEDNVDIQAILDVEDDEEEEDDDEGNGVEIGSVLPADIPLALVALNPKLDGFRHGVVRLTRIARKVPTDPWNIEFDAILIEGMTARLLSVAIAPDSAFPKLEVGDVVRAINGIDIGSPQLSTLRKVFSYLSQQVEIILEVRRAQTVANLWQ